MKTEEIFLANIKCNGCATTIKKEVGKYAGISAVEVYPDQDKISISYDEKLNREDLMARLLSLGYPEATENNGLLTQLKSFASCMVGRIDNMQSKL